MQPAPSVFSISPASPFLATLIDALVEGRLLPHFSLHHPAELGQILVYVPTQRTADALKQAFLPHLKSKGWQSAILPRIQVIGDADEDLMPFKVAARMASNGADGFWHLPTAMDGLQRRLSMTSLVHRWAQNYARAALSLSETDPLHVSSTPADAAYLAIDLLALIDAVHRERSDWALLDTLVPEDFSAFWQISLEFLKIATATWPGYLDSVGLVDPVQRREATLQAEIEAIRAHVGPVIAAGSTGSIPATADLLKAVAEHDQGALILPGLDFHLDEESWQAVGRLHPTAGETTAVAGHPQFNLKQLIEHIGVKRADVTDLSHVSKQMSDRSSLVSEALRPAETTDKWGETLSRLTEEERQEALAKVRVAEADNEQEEARIAAIALREILERPGQRAALVTPDRALARRVLLELKRWSIHVEDTAGMPLAETPPALLLRLMVEAVTEQFDPIRLLALLKHPLASFGLPRSDVRRAARFLEIHVLRGPRLGGGITPVRQELNRKRQEAESRTETGDLTDSTGFKPDMWELCADLLNRLEDAVSSLSSLMERQESPHFSHWMAGVIAAVEAVARNEDGSPDRLYDEAAGRALQSFFDRAGQWDEGALALESRDVAPFLVAMMSGETVLSHGESDPRLQLLGTLEARLLDVDRVVIGGLNEGSWPAETKTDAWLSRPMRAGMKLEPPERRIGLAAHDFAQAMGRSEVVLIRSLKSGGQPTVPSRWLQRLEAVAGAIGTPSHATARCRLWSMGQGP